MEDKRLVATKKDIIIFFVIAISYTIIDFWGFGKIENLHFFFTQILFVSIYFFPPIFAILINNIIKFKNIKNKKTLKIIKLLFNIFTLIYFIFMSLFLSFCYSMSNFFD